MFIDLDQINWQIWKISQFFEPPYLYYVSMCEFNIVWKDRRLRQTVTRLSANSDFKTHRNKMANCQKRVLMHLRHKKNWLTLIEVSCQGEEKRLFNIEIDWNESMKINKHKIKFAIQCETSKNSSKQNIIISRVCHKHATRNYHVSLWVIFFSCSNKVKSEADYENKWKTTATQ